MKTESVKEFLKRGGTIKTIPAGDRPTELTVDYTEKAQESFFEQPVDEVISEALGLPQDSEAHSGSVDVYFRRQASKQISANRRLNHSPEDQSDDTL